MAYKLPLMVEKQENYVLMAASHGPKLTYKHYAYFKLQRTRVLPQFIVLESLAYGGFAYYMNENEKVLGNVSCEKEGMFNPFAKIEVEASKSHPEYVHLRFVHSNKYWGLHGPDDRWIVASSDQPEEDTSKLSCTLFDPTYDMLGNWVSFTHVQSSAPVRVDDHDSISSHVYVDKKDHFASSTYNFAFKVMDWDSLVKLPKYVTFKGDNDKYLKGVRYNDNPYLEFGEDDFNQRSAAYEVYLQHLGGHLRIKSVLFNNFWRRNPNWIWADSTDASGQDIETLFWPVKIDNRTIALQSAGNDNFCRRLTIEGKNNCLNAADENITKAARLVVEEPVLERSIYNVKYRMEDARVCDEKPFVAGMGTATNNSDKEATLAIKVSYPDIRSSTFTYTLFIGVGVTSTIEAGIPFIEEGKIKVSDSVTNSFEWGKTIETSKVVEATTTVNVPARSRVTVNYIGTEGKCSVPFYFVQRDKRSSDGSVVVSERLDGIFYGVNYHSFRFEQLAVEPL